MVVTLADILSDKGYDIDTARNGFSAIDKAERKIFDIALIDIRMPGINGVKTLKKLKQVIPSLVGIMITAYSMENLVTEALESGALCILNKPLDIGYLIELIEST